jgi:hypothetical protein
MPDLRFTRARRLFLEVVSNLVNKYYK